MKFSFTQRRIGAGILLFAALICVGNYYLEWDLFGPFGKQVIIGLFVLIFAYLSYVGSSLQEIREYREAKDRERNVSTGFRLWKYVLSLLLVMVMFLIIGPILRITKGEPVSTEDWIGLVAIEALVVIAGVFGWYQIRKRNGRKADQG